MNSSIVANKAGMKAAIGAHLGSPLPKGLIIKEVLVVVLASADEYNPCSNRLGTSSLGTFST